jgi:predicted flavoprotein YhiN
MEIALRMREGILTQRAHSADVAIVGAGAAGLMAAIFAGRAMRASGTVGRVVALDGARSLGAKILVAGGGRCNVTHYEVDASEYAGSTRAAIKNVLRRFDVPETIAFFAQLGVELKREDTGKLFPTTDKARTVLDALLAAATDAGVQLLYPWCVERVTRLGPDHPRHAELPGGFLIERRAGDASVTEPGNHELLARRVILATGGLSLPKSGSDGHGHTVARSLGHSITPAVFPALVPLVTEQSSTFMHELSGLTLDVTVDLASGTGKKLASFTNSMLMTHFGLSGPAILDISRYYLDAKRTDRGARLSINFAPGQTFDDVDQALAPPANISIGRRASELVPERLARALCAACNVEPSAMLAQLKRDERRSLAHAITALPAPIAGDRGYTYAEVTAGGVPLSELHLSTLESRVSPGLHLCGELCDVDGRIGGFNFQWAWASGFVAGSAAGVAIEP